MKKVLLIILCLFIPPLAVFLKKGADESFIINILLCLLLFIPGVIHSLYIVTR